MSEWIVRRGEAEFRADSLQTLHEWRRSGRVGDGDLVFHPVFNRWLYAKEVEELRGPAPKSEWQPNPDWRPNIGDSPTYAAYAPKAETEENWLSGRVWLLALAAVGIAALAAAAFHLQGLVDAKHAAEESAFLARSAEKDRAASREHSELVADWNANQGAIRSQIELHLANGEAPLAMDLIQKYKPVSSGGFGSAEARAAAAMVPIRMRASASDRDSYVVDLRTHFLDEGLDIKVATSGEFSETLELEYALFGDVWAHKIRQGSLMAEIRSKGFQTVHMSDGYDWQARLTP